MLVRDAMGDLEEWMLRPDRKPLLLRGARQTGKTWLTEEFGRRHFSRVLRLDFLSNDDARVIFEGRLDPRRILDMASMLTGVQVREGETLVILDEVQECPRALTSLKYFCERMRELPVIATGSYMGVAMHPGVSFPVGKVDTLTLRPLSFLEYLRNAGEDGTVRALEEPDASGFADYAPMIGNVAMDRYREYLVTGGMPEVVDAFLRDRDVDEVRAKQQDILLAYDGDFSKHAGGAVAAERIRRIWASLPSQLAKENRRFTYGLIREGARAREYEFGLQWLADYGIAGRVPCLNAIRQPLSAYEDPHAFKMYATDLGLLGALSGLDPRVIQTGAPAYAEFKGALTEQYVCQQLETMGLRPYYWANPDGRAEVDFVVDVRGRAVPIEAKAESNVRAKSLHVAVKKYGLARAVRTSALGYRDEGWLLNLPLWALSRLPRDV